MIKKTQPHPQGHFQIKKEVRCVQTTTGYGRDWQILPSSMHLFGLDILFHLALTTILG